MKLPSEEEIKNAISSHPFTVPYDGTDYHRLSQKHFQMGVEWVMKRIKELNAVEDKPQTLCDNFQPVVITSSATICRHCGREKWFHAPKIR